jgi:hypothetical protein
MQRLCWSASLCLCACACATSPVDTGPYERESGGWYQFDVTVQQLLDHYNLQNNVKLYASPDIASQEIGGSWYGKQDAEAILSNLGVGKWRSACRGVPDEDSIIIYRSSHHRCPAKSRRVVISETTTRERI